MHICKCISSIATITVTASQFGLATTRGSELVGKTVGRTERGKTQTAGASDGQTDRQTDHYENAKARWNRGKEKKKGTQV